MPRLLGVDIPADRPRPPVQTFVGARASHVFAPEVAKGIRALAQRSGVTPYIALLAAFQAFLFRLTGQDDVVVASPRSA